MSDDTHIGGVRQQFPQTRWSVIEGTRSERADERQWALDVLVSAYWKPVYKYIRLHWKKQNEEAKDSHTGFLRPARRKETARPVRARQGATANLSAGMRGWPGDEQERPRNVRNEAEILR